MAHAPCNMRLKRTIKKDRLNTSMNWINKNQFACRTISYNGNFSIFFYNFSTSKNNIVIIFKFLFFRCYNGWNFKKKSYKRIKVITVKSLNISCCLLCFHFLKFILELFFLNADKYLIPSGIYPGRAFEWCWWTKVL